MGTAIADEATPTQTSSVGWVSARQALIAWAAIVVASDFDSIAAHLLGTSAPTWHFSIAKAVVLCVMALSVRVLASTPSYLDRFIWVLAALVAGDSVAGRIQAHVSWFQTASHAQRMFAGVFLSFIPAIIAALTLFRSGFTRKDVFLATGDLRASTRLPFLRGTRWNVVAPILLIAISSTLLVQLWIVSNASNHFRPGMLLAALAPAVVFAALNAFSEEFRFRCLLLAYGSRFMGVAQAITATSVLFGLAHFGGHPSGFSGVAMAAFFAWIVARSMVDTRGLGWAWSLHFIQDVIIFLMVAMTGV
jgi:membrane protease YdiL (CAAX protease family)